MKKAHILQQIIALLDEELERYANSARAAHEEATHEQNKAENKYDTRGLEASYLAQGQSRQAMETWEARREFSRMVPRDFAPEEPVALGAVVEVAFTPGRETARYFIGPRAGGQEVEEEGEGSIMVITPESPLGKLLMGKKAGEKVALEGRREKRTYTIRSIA